MKKHTVDDFNILTVLGKGLYGKVFLVREIETQAVYAMKVMKKSIISRKNKAHYVFSERNILIEVQWSDEHSCNTPSSSTSMAASRTRGSFIFCCSTAQAASCIAYSTGKTNLLKNSKVISYTRAKFYAAQVLLALEYLHDKNVIYRE